MMRGQGEIGADSVLGPMVRTAYKMSSGSKMRRHSCRVGVGVGDGVGISIGMGMKSQASLV